MDNKDRSNFLFLDASPVSPLYLTGTISLVAKKEEEDEPVTLRPAEKSNRAPVSGDGEGGRFCLPYYHIQTANR